MANRESVALAKASPTGLSVVVPIVAGIGNALMAMPLVRQIKRNRPGARVMVVARIEAMAEPFRRVTEVDEVRVMGRGTAGMLGTMLTVAAMRPDVCLIPFPSNRWQYTLLALLSGAGRRVMHAYPIGKLRTLAFAPAQRVAAVKGLHDVVQNLSLLRKLGIEPDVNEAPVFVVNQNDRQRASKLFDNAGVEPNARPIAIHPGSAKTILAEAKRWPPRRYAQLIERLAGEMRAKVVILEGPDEIGVADEIVREIKGNRPAVVRLTGPLGDAAGVMERCRMYVGSDSGLAHLSAAVGTAPVTIFAPADPDRVCPWGYRHLVVQPAGKTCSPCFMYPWQTPYPRMRCRPPMCVGEISVEQVMEAVARCGERGPR